jgi:hypothetical protein
VTLVTETIGVRKLSVAAPETPNQEAIMSSVQLHETTKHTGDLKHRDYGFVLALICMVLALAVASAIFTPLPVGSEISNQMSLVGP